MRILHTGDWHLGKNLEGQSRMDEQEKFLEDFVEIVEENDIDLIIGGEEGKIDLKPEEVEENKDILENMKDWTSQELVIYSKLKAVIEEIINNNSITNAEKMGRIYNILDGINKVEDLYLVIANRAVNPINVVEKIKAKKTAKNVPAFEFKKPNYTLLK